jgi:hypothetical protein
MSLALTILLWILAIVGIILALVLLVPVHVRAQGQVRGLSASGWARARWGFGFISVRASPESGVALYWLGLRIWRFKMKGHKKPRPEKKKKKKEEKADKGSGWFWRNRRMLFWIAGRMYRTLHLKGRIAGTLGLGDPADTAWLWMFLWQLEGRVPGLELSLQCDWQDEELDLDGDVRAWIWPLQVLVVAAFTFLRRDVRRALRSAA